MCRKVRLAACAVAAVAGLLAPGSNAVAQQLSGSVGASVGAGFKAPDYKSAWLIAGDLLLWPTAHFGVGAGGSLVFLPQKFCSGICEPGFPSPPLVTQHAFAMAFTARLRLDPSRPVDPYALIGVGFATLGVTKLQIVGGGGVAIRLGTNWQLRPELRFAHQGGSFPIEGLSRVTLTLARTF